MTPMMDGVAHTPDVQESACANRKNKLKTIIPSALRTLGKQHLRWTGRKPVPSF